MILHTHNRSAMPPRLIRALRWFDSTTNELVDEAVLPAVTAKDLHKRSDTLDDVDAVLCYAVTPKQAAFVAERSGVQLDLERYDYFVEVDAVSVAAETAAI